APGEVIAEAAASVAPGVGFSTLIVALVFLPLMMLTGLEGRFFRPLGLSYLCVFTMSLVAAAVAVPALARLFRLGARLLGGRKRAEEVRAKRAESLGIRAMRAVYRPFLWIALKLPKTVVLAAALLTAGAVWVAKDFGSSFLPPFREDAFNVALSLPPGASLAETERVAEACVPAMASIPGVLSVTRRTGRAERDQHAEPVSSSEYVVRVDLEGDTDAVKAAIRERLGSIPGCSLLVGYPIAHRIGAVLSGTEAEVAVNVFGEDVEVLRAVVARMKTALDGMPEVSDVRANREVTVRSLRIDYDADALLEAGLTLREAGEQVAAAFNGVEAGEVRDGLRRRAVVVRLAGCEAGDAEAVKGLLLSGRNGRRVRLDDVARVVPEEASNLMLREGGRRKALISCNAADGVNTGELVERLRARLEPIASAAGCTVSFGGSYEARESAGRRLAALGVGLVVVIFFILVVALASVRAAVLALVNVPLGLIGAVVAVMLADPVLSVSSLVGFVTVIGFVLRNGLLLLNRYQDRLAEGADLETAIREGSEERMPPIVMTSLTTVFGLVPIIIAGSKPGGELLAPLAVVQFGGLLGATVLNLVVLPAAVKVFGLSPRSEKDKVPPARTPLAVCLCAGMLAALVGCRSYEPKPIDWATEVRRGATNEVVFANLDEVAQM
ncbi:MAG: efflux RND transporter permease subunit, partial [bacterium]|nr:efflux RND transporter permease subunit [bacterium]